MPHVQAISEHSHEFVALVGRDYEPGAQQKFLILRRPEMTAVTPFNG